MSNRGTVGEYLVRSGTAEDAEGIAAAHVA